MKLYMYISASDNKNYDFTSNDESLISRSPTTDLQNRFRQTHMVPLLDRCSYAAKYVPNNYQQVAKNHGVKPIFLCSFSDNYTFEEFQEQFPEFFI